MLKHTINTAIELGLSYAPKLLLAILTLIIGFWAIGKIVKIAMKLLYRSSEEETLNRFLGSLIAIALKVALIISVASMVGVETTSFIAILGAAGLAIGLALQGSLSNFAGGTLIVLFKPFKVGDYIEAQGHAGTVHEVQIFNTILKTPDNRTIILPNGGLANGSITNYSTESERRVDFVFGIGYNDDIDQAKSIIEEIIKADSRILTEKAPQVVVSALADSSVNITVRVWAKASDYWGIYFDMQEKVKKTFDAKGVGIPYPHQEVYVHQVSS